uniref:Uncharacterized protein n=1 Tax=Romanomermis culicivorax TaxID=13658 RepID=A0A915K5H5_ROMCU
MADKEAEDSVRREYLKRQQEIKAAQGTAPTLSTKLPKREMNKFLGTAPTLSTKPNKALHQLCPPNCQSEKWINISQP